MLVGSALPLLSDFGLIVTMNVAVALLSALVAMPPILVWADGRGWLGIETHGSEDGEHAVVLADRIRPGFLVATVAVAIVAVALFLSADTEDGSASVGEFTPVALPTTTTTTTTLDPNVEPPPTEEIDVTQFGTERPIGTLEGLLYDFLTQAGADPQRAVCSATILLERFTTDELVAGGIGEFSDEGVAPVVVAAQDCGIPDDQIDDAIAIARGG